MNTPDTSVLGYALLGLIQQKPSSGYDLRKTFAETAMGNYSSSPGAIYPALERLQSRGLVRGKTQDTAGLRRRRLYTLSRSGEVELKEWLARPIVREDVARGTDELMLRFAFLEPVLGVEAAIAFLKKMQAELGAYIPELESFLRRNRAAMPLSARLALESGIRGYRTLQEWSAYGIRTYRKSRSSSSPPGPAKSKRKGGFQ
jgi:DNA-binding PadR family transcriptional regulator